MTSRLENWTGIPAEDGDYPNNHIIFPYGLTFSRYLRADVSNSERSNNFIWAQKVYEAYISGRSVYGHFTIPNKP